jgi:hypothetical protein
MTTLPCHGVIITGIYNSFPVISLSRNYSTYYYVVSNQGLEDGIEVSHPFLYL